MLEFLTGVFIILLSIFFLFISSNKKIEYKNQENQKIESQKNFLGENTNEEKQDSEIIVDITDGEEKSGKVVLNNIEKENEINKKSNEIIKDLEELNNKMTQKEIEEKINFRKQELKNIFGEKYLNDDNLKKYLDINVYKDEDFQNFIQKAKKIKQDLEKKKKEEELAKKQKEEELKKQKELAKKQAEEKKEKTKKENKQIEKNDNIDFSKYVSLKQRTKNSFKVYLYKNGKVEEKWIGVNISPIKNTMNLVLKDRGVKINSLVLKNKNLILKLSNKQKLTPQIKKEIITTAKFFPQINNVIIK